jgi:hypothetical protein
MTIHTPQPDPVTLTTLAGLCPECEYALTGLPPRGRCPECGREYDQSIIVLRGWASGELATGLGGRRRDAVPLAVSLIVLISIMASYHRIMTPELYLLLITAMLPLFRIVLEQLLVDRQEPVRVRLTAFGFDQRVDLATGSIGKFVQPVLIMLMWMLFFVAMGWLLSRRTLHAGIIIVMAGPGVVMLGMELFRAAKRWRQPLQRWRSVTRCSLSLLEEDRYRLRVEELSYWRRKEKELVDFEFRAIPERVELIRRQIDGWLAASGSHAMGRQVSTAAEEASGA